MGLYRCFECGGIRNSDDGCNGHPDNGMELICPDCEDEINQESIDLEKLARRDTGPTGHGDICWSDADPGL